MSLARLVLLLLLALACGPADAGADPGTASGEAFDAARREAATLDRQGVTPNRRIKAWRAVHALRPDGATVNEKLGRALLDGRRLGEAAEVLWRAIELTPPEGKDDPAYHRLLIDYATLLADLGREQEAMMLLVYMPDDADAAVEFWAVMAELKDRTGDRDGARARADAAIQLAPDRAWRALALRGRFHFEDGDYEAARRDFRSAISQRPDAKPALKGLADTERRAGNDELADRWDEILQLVVDLTDNLVEAGDPSFRRARLERLAELHPRFVAGWSELLAMVQESDGAPAACARLERILAEEPPGLSTEQRLALRARHCEESP